MRHFGMDFSNDPPGTGSSSSNLPTHAHLCFAAGAAGAAGYHLNFEYFFVPATGTLPFGNSSAHMRDVSLTTDGLSFR